MNIEFIKNPVTGVLEAWEDGRVVGEFIPTGMMVKGWKLTDCIVRKEQEIHSIFNSIPIPIEKVKNGYDYIIRGEE